MWKLTFIIQATSILMSLWKLQMVSALLSLSLFYGISCGEKKERNKKISRYLPGGLNIDPHPFVQTLITRSLQSY